MACSSAAPRCIVHPSQTPHGTCSGSKSPQCLTVAGRASMQGTRVLGNAARLPTAASPCPAVSGCSSHLPPFHIQRGMLSHSFPRLECHPKMEKNGILIGTCTFSATLGASRSCICNLERRRHTSFVTPPTLARQARPARPDRSFHSVVNDVGRSRSASWRGAGASVAGKCCR